MYKLCVYVPESHLEAVKTALFQAGAGKIGDYDSCCWHSLGTTYCQACLYTLAIEALEKAVELEPTAKSYNNLGIAYQDQARFDEAAATDAAAPAVAHSASSRSRRSPGR